MSESHLTPPESWKPIPGYEGLYEVSDYGRVKTLRRGRWGNRPEMLSPIVKATRSGKRYFKARLTKDKILTVHSVHRLVAIAFIGPPPDPLHEEINHRDGNPSNNHVSNLEWCSRLENMQHAAQNNLVRKGKSHHWYGAGYQGRPK